MTASEHDLPAVPADEVPSRTQKPSPTISLRLPTTSTHHPQQPPSFTPPTPEWLSGKWHVTHSTLPMWKSKRNVSITYTPLPASTTTTTTTTTSDSSPLPRLNDLVSYHSLSSPKPKTVEGIDTPSPSSTGGEWDWRGKGWLKIASSHWEVLGWGDLDDGNKWAVTFFAKTLFTPMGVDVYSRSKEGLPEGVVEGIRGALGGSGDVGGRGLVGGLFEVVRD